jgi:hypothetical protein
VIDSSSVACTGTSLSFVALMILLLMYHCRRYRIIAWRRCRPAAVFKSDRRADDKNFILVELIIFIRTLHLSFQSFLMVVLNPSTKE